jgi:hypothetical protein
MTGPPNKASQTAPPVKRAKPDGIPVRLDDGTLIAHANPELEQLLLSEGAAEAFRRGARRYLRLRPGIHVPRTARGWDLMEFLRRWHGDKKAAAYVEHKDRQSGNVRYKRPRQPPQIRGPRESVR